MRWIAAILVFLMAATAAVAQIPAEQKPKFEVASIKPNTSGIGSVALDASKGRFLASNMTIRTLLRYAFDRQLPEDDRGRGSVLFSSKAGIQVVGGPGWITSDRFDVEGKPSVGDVIKQPEMQLMVQSLLDDRFQLKAHYESREVPVYHLVLVKEGKMRRSEDQTSGPAMKNTRSAVFRYDEAVQPSPPWANPRRGARHCFTWSGMPSRCPPSSK
ncbi:MAG TPA: TIGR03435 family protein [Terriglobia bacterium]|jgi:uncharacterized protein (TIGR03435 family)